jgi:hypothetical protein
MTAGKNHLAKMRARGQLGAGEYKAARAYQRAQDKRAAEQVIATRCGEDGLLLVRMLVDEGCTLNEAAARTFGAASDRERQFVGWYFRRSLSALASRLGYQT